MKRRISSESPRVPTNLGRRRRIVQSGLLAFLMTVCGGSAMAQQTVMEIGPNFIQTLFNQMNTYTQRYQDEIAYAEQVQRWQQTYAHYQQQLIKLKSIIASFQLPAGQKIERVPDTYMVETRCGVTGFSLGQMMGFDNQSDLVGQQKNICASIQVMENRKFNETVDFLKETMPNMQAVLSKARTRRDASNQKGNVDASLDDSIRLSNDFTTKFKEWETRINLYNTYIGAMKDTQRGIAERALKGERNPLGTMLKAVALKKALQHD